MLIFGKAEESMKKDRKVCRPAEIKGEDEYATL